LLRAHGPVVDADVIDQAGEVGSGFHSLATPDATSHFLTAINSNPGLLETAGASALLLKTRDNSYINKELFLFCCPVLVRCEPPTTSI
jgi:hypothetical protein